MVDFLPGLLPVLEGNTNLKPPDAGAFDVILIGSSVVLNVKPGGNKFDTSAYFIFFIGSSGASILVEFNLNPGGSKADKFTGTACGNNGLSLGCSVVVVKLNPLGRNTEMSICSTLSKILSLESFVSDVFVGCLKPGGRSLRRLSWPTLPKLSSCCFNSLFLKSLSTKGALLSRIITLFFKLIPDERP